MVVSHELGHNIGANHTHDCVWNADASYNFAGGAIDNCNMYSSLFDPENSCYGNPDGLFLNSNYEYGTIMSYCHVTSLAELYFEFHPIVKSQVLIPKLNNSCLNSNCENLQYACGEPYPDSDGDGIVNDVDNCVDDYNITQSDNDNDGVGNACDNCYQIYNITQSDNDNDGVGNVCDNCYQVYNPDQIDSDGDGRLTGGEIVGSGKVNDAKLALAIFLELDANGDEVLHLPEFLHTWGRWARTGKETKDRR